MIAGATLTEDRYGEDGTANYFDGVDDFISVMDSPDFDIGERDMTVLAYILPQDPYGYLGPSRLCNIWFKDHFLCQWDS